LLTADGADQADEKTNHEGARIPPRRGSL